MSVVRRDTSWSGSSVVARNVAKSYCYRMTRSEFRQLLHDGPLINPTPYANQPPVRWRDLHRADGARNGMS